MNASVTIFEIRYQEPASQFLFMDSLVKSLASKKIEGRMLVGGNFEINLKEKRTKILIGQQRIAISVESFENLTDLTTLFDEILKKIFSKLSFSKIQRVGIRTLWIKEVEGNMQDLVNKYKKVFYVSNPLIDESVDVSVPLTLNNNGNTVNFNSGPMDKQQYITQFSQIKDGEKIPEKFIFVDIDYTNQNNIFLSKKDAIKFISEGYNYAEKKNEEVCKILS